MRSLAIRVVSRSQTLFLEGPRKRKESGLAMRDYYKGRKRKIVYLERAVADLSDFNELATSSVSAVKRTCDSYVQCISFKTPFREES